MPVHVIEASKPGMESIGVMTATAPDRRSRSRSISNDVMEKVDARIGKGGGTTGLGKKDRSYNHSSQGM